MSHYGLVSSIDNSELSTSGVKYRNIEATMIALDDAIDIAEEFIEDDDAREDFFSEINSVSIALESVLYESYIDLLQQEVEFMFQDRNEVEQHKQRLSEMKEYIIHLSDMLIEVVDIIL